MPRRVKPNQYPLLMRCRENRQIRARHTDRASRTQVLALLTNSTTQCHSDFSRSAFNRPAPCLTASCFGRISSSPSDPSPTFGVQPAARRLTPAPSARPASGPLVSLFRGCRTQRAAPGPAARPAHRLRAAQLTCLPGASGAVLATPFSSQERGSGALKPVRDVQGHGRESCRRGGDWKPQGSPAAPRSKFTPAVPSGSPPGPPPASRAGCRLPALTLAPERGQQRQEQQQPQRPGPAELVHRPAGALEPSGAWLSPLLARRRCCCGWCYIPAAWDRLEKSSQEPPARWALQRFNSLPPTVNYTACKCSAELSGTAARRQSPCCADTPTLSSPPPHRLGCKCDSLRLGKLYRSSAWT